MHILTVIPYNLLVFIIVKMPAYIVENDNHINQVIALLTEDRIKQLKIHICKLAHQDVYCCDQAQLMHDGQHPFVSVAYVADHLESQFRVIVNQLLDHFPIGDPEDDEDEDVDENDVDSIMSCPGCGVPFSQQ